MTQLRPARRFPALRSASEGPSIPRRTTRATLRAGRVAAAVVGSTLGAGARATLGVRSSGLLKATDLEVVTVTDTSVTFCWATYPGNPTRYGRVRDTLPAGTIVRMAPTGGQPVVVHRDDTPRGYHFVTVGGLEPDTTYAFECWSDGVRAEPGLVATRQAGTPERTGRVTTLPTPAGRYVTTIAIVNDTHIGEDEQGQLVGDMRLPDIREADAGPYPEFMVAGMIREIRAAGVRTLLVNGDLTAQARPAEVRRVKELLDGFGRQGSDWFAVRGNHDQPHRPSFDPAAGYEQFPVLDGTEDHRDPFGEIFNLPRQQLWSARVGELRVVGLDSCQLDHSGGQLDPAQLDALAAELAADPDRPTLMIAHHPVTREAAWTNLSGPMFVLPAAESMQLQQLHRRAPGVFMMAAGHTHRVRRTAGDAGADVDYVELGASAGYPGGYTLVHLYTGGFRVNFHRVHSDEALRWAARSRWAAFGIQPEYTLGTVHDRNYVVDRDLSALVPDPA